MSDDPIYLQKEFVLRHLLRVPGLLEPVIERIEKYGVFSDTGDLEWIWNAVAAYYTKYHKPVPMDVLLLDLRCVLAASGMSTFEPEISNKIRHWFEVPIDPAARDMVSDLLKQFFLETMQTELKNSLQGGEPQEKLRERLRQLEHGLTDQPLKIPQERNPFWKAPHHFLRDIERIPTGIDFIDNALGGGVRLGEVGAFLMPSKGGKTTIVYQLQRELVYRRKHGLVLSFEQYLEGDLSVRMYVLSTGTGRKDWARGVENMSPELLERWYKVAPLWGYYLHFFDHWVDPQNSLHSVGEVFRIVEEYRAKGINIQWVMLDWWGCMLRKLISANPVRSDWEKRQQEATWLGEIKAYTQKLGVCTLVFHQLAGAEAGKSERHVSTSFRAQENSNFCNMLDWCFVSSRKDGNSDVTFKLDVARSAASSGKIRVHLDGQNCQFVGKGPDYAASTLTDMQKHSGGTPATMVDDNRTSYGLRDLE